ncbi:MAG: O-antigen ligase family protein [Terracidiphilus sp.]|nr:O-antigen ligase family protein [Terracidiphilus sp.]
MRTSARTLLLIFAFAIPWEYSLDFGAPLGNAARLAGLAVLAAAIPATLREGRLRTPGSLHWLSIALFLWLCASYFWSIDPTVTLNKLPGYAQELMIVWLVGEFVDSERDPINLLGAWLAGCAVLAGLTLSAVLIAAHGTEQIRFFAVGEDPNDTARFLALGLPIAMYLAVNARHRWQRWVTILYLPIAVIAIVATASRGGFVEALVAFAFCATLVRRGLRGLVGGTLVLSLILAGGAMLVIPHGTIERIATLSQQIQGGDFNQRINIWQQGWRAFQSAPVLGHGAGTFVEAAGLSPIDTAHNTALSILVEGGISGLALGVAIVAHCAVMAFAARGSLRIVLIALLAVWAVASFVGTTGESRITWLLFATVAAAARLNATYNPAGVETKVESGPLRAGAGA